MCGITGIINLNRTPVSPTILKQMTDAVEHRGPDGEGHWIEENIGLGHRRLAIIDLSPAANQPMMSTDGRYVISYNGEVYNFQHLRTELQAAGYQFQSRSDTEVVLNGFSCWGQGLLSRLNGMFAFAIWDKVENQLILARDRYGIKPVYFYNKSGLFLFGSEIKSILTHPEVHADLDKQGLIEYFTFQNFFTDRTLFKNIHLLPSASILSVDLPTQSVEIKKYWDYQFSEPQSPLSEEDYIEQFNYLFKQAVNRQLISDVPVATYLSGGIDSGSITSIASQQIEGLRSFTVGFDLSSASGLELGFDERALAEQISYHCQTEHYEMVLKAGDMERCLRQVVWHLEEPRVGQSYPNYYAAKLASKFNKVVLAGTGGDELFGGYPWRYYRAVVNDDFEHYIDKYYSFWQRLLPDDILLCAFSPLENEVQRLNTRNIMHDAFQHHAHQLQSPEEYINHSLYFEAKTFLHSLFIVEDKLAMAHGLEVRVPFLDNDLVDFAMRVPVGIKLGNLTEIINLNENEAGNKIRKYFQKTNYGKLILRKALAQYLPEDMTNGIKQGFSAPDASWFRGESIDFVRDTLYDPKANIYDYMDHKAITALLDEHLLGKVNRRLLIWSLLNFNEWCNVFLKENLKL